MANRTRVKKPAAPKRAAASSGELGETLKHVNKRFGEGSVRRANQILQPDRISTGSFMLDFSLLGGIPTSRVTMAVGERHAGKSTLSNKVIAQAQKQFPGQTPIVIDIEGTFESNWARQLGVDIENLPIVPCETGEMAVDVADAVITSEETSLVIIDSLAAMAPMKELDASAEDNFVGLQSRLIGNMVRRVNAALIGERKRGHNVTVLFLNQFRSKIGISHGDPRSIPGGKAVEFCTSVQVIIKNKENKGKDSRGIEGVLHNDHSYTITKNKLNQGPRTGEFALCRVPNEELGLDVGDIDDAGTMLSFAKKFGAYGGGGTKWKLEYDNYSYVFRNAKEGMIAMYEDPAIYLSLRNWLIREQAKHLGMPKSFLDTFKV